MKMPSVEIKKLTASQPMTNADRIRAMSDEELANVLGCPHNVVCLANPKSCPGCRLHWLQQPCGGADHA